MTNSLRIRGFICILVLMLTACLTACDKQNATPDPIRMQFRQSTQKLPPIGKTVTLAPMKPTGAPKTWVGDSSQNILLHVTQEGMDLSYDAKVKILIYPPTPNGDQPAYTITPEELKNAYLTTHCSESLSPYFVEARAGEGLFCNSTLDLRKIGSRFVLDKGDRKKESSELGIEFKKDGVLGLVLSFD